MSRFTILGASGTVGQALAAYLRAAGEDVFAPARGDDAIWHEDLGRVIYCIGVTADFRARPLETIEAHVTVLHRVLAEARFDRLVYLSSTRVYGAADANDTPAREDRALSVDPQSGSDLYNLSKLMGESLCLHGSRGRAVVARLSNVVGGEDADSENFLPSLLREARTGQIHLRSALDSAKDYIHIDDAVPVLATLAKGPARGIYNVASGIRTPHAEWIAAITAATGAQVSVEPDAPLFLFPPIDITRIRSEFGASPRAPVASISPHSALACPARKNPPEGGPMDPIAAFAEERRQHLEAYAKDAEFRTLSQRWLEASMRKKYVYNFDWLGRPIIQYPQDMWAVQELVWQVKPDLIVETGIAHGGSLILSASMLAMLDYCDAMAAGKRSIRGPASAR